MFIEILSLHEFCREKGIHAEIVSLFDGFKLSFPNSDDFSDFVQHSYSYGATHGCVEPAIGCADDYTAVPLEDAKKLVLEHRQKLDPVGFQKENP